MSHVYFPPGWTPPPVGQRPVDVAARAEEMGKCGLCLDIDDPHGSYCHRCGRASEPEQQT